MTARTYYPGAVKIAERAHRYLSRYQPKLVATVTPAQATALASLIAELANFLAAWPPPTVLP